jgi:hypothetical protein
MEQMRREDVKRDNGAFITFSPSRAVYLRSTPLIVTGTISFPAAGG